MSDFGFLYVATGRNHLREAIASALSVREFMPGYPVVLFTDSGRDLPPGVFSDVRPLSGCAHTSFDKIAPLLQSPFRKTLFLDTDTVLVSAVTELAALLDRFDIAYAHAPVRIYQEIAGISQAFPEPNSGVLLYKQCDEINKLLRDWGTLYTQLARLFVETPGGRKKPLRDQPALRTALFKSRARICVLPPEYNLRTVYPWFVGGNARVKILHGRGATLERALKDFAGSNAAPSPRVSQKRT